jgi:hypothetical protein
MRLLRQDRQGDWNPVLTRASLMLDAFIATSRL